MTTNKYTKLLQRMKERRMDDAPDNLDELRNTRAEHKTIDKLWQKFLKDVENLGYVVPHRLGGQTITLHNSEFTPNDLTGRYELVLPTHLTKR